MNGLICLSISEKKISAIQKVLASRSVKNFPHNIVEIQASQKLFTHSKFFDELIQTSEKPFLLKCRGAPSQKTLKFILKKKFFALDLDVKFLKKLTMPRRGKIKIIISQHLKKHEHSYEKLASKMSKMYELGADIIKLVMPCSSKNKTRQIALLARLIRETGRPVIAHLGGNEGKQSRLMLFKKGSYITYIARNAKSKTATGQWKMVEWMRIVRP